jgi:hypothetical protein
MQLLLEKNSIEKNSDIKVDHLNINNELLLEEAIKESNTVVYFTHDYFTLVEDKNTQLLNTAKICKAYDVEKLVAVNPIELINYYDACDNCKDPVLSENETQEKALYLLLN